MQALVPAAALPAAAQHTLARQSAVNTGAQETYREHHAVGGAAVGGGSPPAAARLVREWARAQRRN